MVPLIGVITNHLEALEDLWMNHGKAGEPGVSASTTDDVIVIYVEGDNSTTLADLQELRRKYSG